MCHTSRIVEMCASLPDTHAVFCFCSISAETSFNGSPENDAVILAEFVRVK